MHKTDKKGTISLSPVLIWLALGHAILAILATGFGKHLLIGTKANLIYLLVAILLPTGILFYLGIDIWKRGEKDLHV